ncbi:MAG: hypothetical protein KDA89_04330, partial [Planctomycetaceae bacterium]|nr:hypothetical protein [Planctomycetaceae bacterium]
DLKPENVIIGEYGEVIILDWGLAVPAPDSGKKKFVPGATHGAGTPAYMAPELWTGPADRISRWSDIYLLGAILFEILTGAPPHKFEVGSTAPTPSQKFAIIDSVVRPNEIRETGVTGELMDIAMKAMHTVPEKRHRTVQEFQEAIRNYMRHEESRHLTRRADDLMKGKTGKRTEGYEDYQTANALYEEALRGWDGNEAARQSLFQTKLKYAELAYNRGDFDLGLQLVSNNDEREYAAVHKKLATAKRKRGTQKTMLTALMTIVLIGGPAVAGYLYMLLGNLNNARTEIASAESKVTEANQKVLDADQKVAEADQKIADAEAEAERTIEAANKQVATATAEVEAQKTLAAEEKKKADIAKVEANQALAAAETAKTEAEMAKTAATEAEMAAATATANAKKAEEDVAKANEALAAANMAVEKAEETRKQAEGLATAAQITRDAQQIISLTQTNDFAGAIEAINALLNSPELGKLDEQTQQQRRTELTAQKEQLEWLSTQTNTPVRSQRTSPDGTRVAWIHSATSGEAGGISVHELDPATHQPRSEAAALWQLKQGEIVGAEFLSADQLICAGENKLTRWTLQSDQRQVAAVAQNRLTALTRFGNLMITADSEGILEAWPLDKNDNTNPVWRFKADTEVRDLKVLASEGLLLCAGSRGNISADVTAIRLPRRVGERPATAGTMRFDRSSMAPPQVVAVSPANSELMIMGNSQNGSILILPRNANSSSFPFVSPADLAKRSAGGWLQTKHSRPVNAIAFSPDGRTIATASDDRTIGIWRVEGSGTANVRVVWDEDRLLQGHGAAVTDVTFVAGAQSPTVLSTSRDRYSRVWDVEHQQEYRDRLKRVLEHGDETVETTRAADDRNSPMSNKPRTVQRNEDDERPEQPKRISHAVQPAADERIARERIAGSEPPGVRHHFEGMSSFSDRLPRRRYLLTSSPADERPYLVLNNSDQSAASGEILRGGIRSVDITPDGSRVAAGGADGTAVVWNAVSGQVITGASQQNRFNRRGELFEEGHKFNISRLQFLPPINTPAGVSQICLSSSFDGSLCLWQANPLMPDFGSEKNRVTNLRLINAVGVSPLGDFIVTSSLGDNQSGREQRHPCVKWNVTQLLEGIVPDA